MKGWSLVDVDLSLMLGICDRYSTTTSPELIKGWSPVGVDLSLMLGICERYSTSTQDQPFIYSRLVDVVSYLSKIQTSMKSQHQQKINKSSTLAVLVAVGFDHQPNINVSL